MLHVSCHQDVSGAYSMSIKYTAVLSEVGHAVRVADGFRVEVVLNCGSALNPLLFEIELR